MTVGENIARLRKARQWSQERFAEELGMRQPAVSKIEKSRSLPELQTALKVAIVLGCSVDDLLDGVDAAYDAILKTVKTVPNRTGTAGSSVPQSALPAQIDAEDVHGSFASSADLDALTPRRHEAVALAVELLRLLLGSSGLDATANATQPGRRKVG